MTGSLSRGSDASAQFDPSQFRLQSDGTFRISIRGMAAMAGIAASGLSQSLSSAVHENPLPCARSLVAQGFDPVHVSTWGETGGIPEEAAPFILEHYGINAASPSAQARAVLLAFSRVGINAYLKERLGVAQPQTAQPVLEAYPPLQVLSGVKEGIALLKELGGVDDRAELLLRDVLLNSMLRLAGGGMAALPQTRMMALQEAFQQLGGATPKEATDLACRHGRQWKAMYKRENGRLPRTHQQFVKGRSCDVCDYELEWLQEHIEDLRHLVEESRLR